MMFTTKERAAEIKELESTRIYCAKRYNELAPAEREEPSIGMTTRGKYLLATVKECEARINWLGSLAN